MSRYRSFNSGAGWTLLEMAVVLTIAALLAVIVLPMLPLGVQMSEQELAETRLQEAQEALIGYSRSHYRLPYADQDGDGNEDIGSLSGQLPSTTLGLSNSTPIGYAVTGELAKAADALLYNPDLPSVAGPARQPVSNGLDFCVRAANAQRASRAYLSPTSAFTLSHRLPDEGGLAAALTASTAFDGPNPAQASLQTSGLGVGELYARLGCVDRLPRAFAAAQSAQTAQSEYLLAHLHMTTRDFYLDIADLDRENAQVGVDFAAFDLAFALLEIALSSVMAVPDVIPPDDAFKVAVAIAQGLIASAQLATAIVSLVQSADQAKEDAGTGYAAAVTAKENAAAQLARIAQLRDAATAKAKQLDEMGLEQ